jgi:hypothetical protein
LTTEIGEYIVGAYLKLILNCDFVDYNVCPPGGGLKGLEELDVLGLDFKIHAAYLCEVTTHITGLLYVNYSTTLERIQKKYERQKSYAHDYLDDFPTKHFMFWSPVVPEGVLTEGLNNIVGLELVINGNYKQSIDKLRELAKVTSHDTKNPFFRVLQILEHLRD